MKNLKKLTSTLIPDNNSIKHLVKLGLMLLVLTSSVSVFAQIELYPLPSPGANTRATQNGRVQSDSILTLPFWDDFTTTSKDADGNAIANEYLWQNSQSVTINNSMAINQPTINVATFDGLDSVNKAYNNSVLVSGVSDKLESGQFDFSSYKMSADSGTIFLSFFYQWKGKGEAPDKNDFIRLDFMDVDSVWRPVKTYYPGEVLDETKFNYVIQKVDTAYQHKNFHFRIVRYGKNSGPFDTWNVDYIYLAKGRAKDNIYFWDFAMASEFSTLFGPYRSMPLKHLDIGSGATLNDMDFAINNLRNIAAPLSAGNTFASIKSTIHYTSSTTTSEKTTPVPDISTFQGRKTFKLPMSITYDEPSLFDTLAEDIDLKFTFYIESKDTVSSTLPAPPTPYKTDFAPFDLLRNDTLYANYHLADYYAHDDGEAEYSVGVNGKGNMVTQRFDLAKDDYLTGVDVYFPDFGSSTTQSTRIVVYDMKDSLPNKAIFRRIIALPKSELNNFTRITFTKRAVSGSIFVGWEEQYATDPIKVGIDYSNVPKDITYQYVNTVWERFDRIHGSLMVRPVFGIDTTVIAGVESEPDAFRVYPNPSEGAFMIKGDYDKLNVISLTGQSVPFIEEQLADEKRITIRSTPGLYLLKLQRKTRIQTKKILIR